MNIKVFSRKNCTFVDFRVQTSNGIQIDRCYDNSMFEMDLKNTHALNFEKEKDAV